MHIQYKVLTIYIRNFLIDKPAHAPAPFKKKTRMDSVYQESVLWSGALLYTKYEQSRVTKIDLRLQRFTSDPRQLEFVK